MERKRLSSVRFGEQLESRYYLTAITFVEHRIASDDSWSNMPRSLLLADFDGDGDSDLLTTANSQILFFEKVDGNEFGNASILHQEEQPLFIEAVDVDSDGDLDILATFYNEVTIALFENLDARGTFSERKSVGLAGYSTSLVVTDLDLDGDQDVIASHTHWNQFEIGFMRYGSASWYENLDGHDSFSAPMPVLNDGFSRVWDIAASDVDNDGDQDLILLVGQGRSPVFIENQGEGQFGNPIYLAPGQPADVDSDGDVDDFSDINYAAYSRYARDIDIDMDIDGDIDVVSSSRGGLVWLERTEGQINVQHAISPENDSVQQHLIFVTDVDGDGDTDIVQLRDYSEEGCFFLSCNFTISWFENRQIGDSNDDGVFNSSDFIKVFQAAKYEDEIVGNASFDEGDWNQDGDFDSSDFVFAFSAANYVAAASPLDGQIAGTIDRLFAQHDDDTNRGRVFVP